MCKHIWKTNQPKTLLASFWRTGKIYFIVHLKFISLCSVSSLPFGLLGPYFVSTWVFHILIMLSTVLFSPCPAPQSLFLNRSIVSLLHPLFSLQRAPYSSTWGFLATEYYSSSTGVCCWQNSAVPSWFPRLFSWWWWWWRLCQDHLLPLPTWANISLCSNASRWMAGSKHLCIIQGKHPYLFPICYLPVVPAQLLLHNSSQTTGEQSMLWGKSVVRMS